MGSKQNGLGEKGPGRTARFTGVMVGDKKRKVDFRDQMGIYVLYEKFENPIQIGQSKNIFDRLNQHRKDHLRNRWAFLTWFGFYKVGKKNKLLVKKDVAAELRRTVKLEESLNEIEAVLIQVMEPRLNRRGANWKKVKEYLQIDDSLKEGEVDDIEDES